MLPFFRKIRYRLAENNQFFKYSRYAIGEIVLVVVGILIALQVNDWNDQRKLRKEEKNALMRLHKESELVVEYVKERQESREYLLIQMEKAAKALQERSLENIEEIDFGMGIFLAGIYQAVSPPRSTFDELKSSGKIQLIQSNQIQEAISDYYVDLDYINVQLVYFRNQFTDPVSAAPNDYWFTYNPDFEMKINWNFDFENLASNRVFVSKHTKALRDQIVFQKYYKEHLLPSAQEMCRKLGRALDASCSSEINN